MPLPKVHASLSKQQPQARELHPMAFYRAWSGWCAKLDGGGYQVHTAKWLENLDAPTRVDILCEVLARASMECALGLHFDHADMRTDILVAEQIRSIFDAPMLAQVVALVSAQGPLMDLRRAVR